MYDAERNEQRINLDKPRYSQDTYKGRAKHFFETTNPLNVFASDAKLQAASKLVKQYRNGKEPLHTSREDVFNAKKLYESAFHPGTGEKLFLVGMP